ncbi:helix-turn-helix domain-containing protein [Paenarthrobacter histidinolovorans]|uniref:helix-turn-helix domain-containing protein n=1 Tax=Paenarthrobacter histidinolovorans TaxID=43664 RepID=UPI00166B3687|nr:helix-turn-helix transcriptional regulator [Paenarthrobacter histidinolovorans]
MGTNSEPEGIGEAAERAFGTRVRELRTALGMTQAELASRMTDLGYGMSQTMVAKLERGVRPTSVGELAVLGEILDVPLADLLAGESLPPEIARIHEARLRVYNKAAAVQEHRRELERAATSLEVQRVGLEGSVRVYNEALAEARNAHGDEWLSSWGVDPGAELDMSRDLAGFLTNG